MLSTRDILCVNKTKLYIFAFQNSLFNLLSCAFVIRIYWQKIQNLYQQYDQILCQNNSIIYILFMSTTNCLYNATYLYIINHLIIDNIINMFLRYINVPPLGRQTVTREIFGVSNWYSLVTFMRTLSKLWFGKKKIMPVAYSENISIRLYCYATKLMLKSIDKLYHNKSLSK